MCGVEKLCYLFQKTSGDAGEINRNIAIMEENFKIAWGNLRSRYENKRVLFNKQLHNLYSITACSSENPDEIKRLQREINNITSTLKLYRINEKHGNRCSYIIVR